jgi:phosphoglycerate dehydrogenase-like enzyme
VVITPHIAGSQGNEVRRLGRLAVTEVERYARGEPPLHPVTAADLRRIA